MSPESVPFTSSVSAFKVRAGFQLAPGRRTALLRPGSLSSRLQSWSPGRLEVTVVKQGHCLPTRDEAKALGMGSREGVWMREVRLGPRLAPWVTARTVSPLKEMHGPSQFLRNLGTRPLGSILFSGRVSGRAWRRSPFQIGLLEITNAATDLPARRSVFFQRGARLLVTEGFYPRYWQQLRQDRNRSPMHRTAVA